MYKSLTASKLMSQKLLNRLFSAVAAFSLLVNSFSAPLAVYAQNATDSALTQDTQTPSETPTPTEEPTITPEATPTPTEEVTPTPTIEETVTPTPEEQPAQQTESQPSQDSQSSQTQEVTGEPTPTPEVSVEETQEQGVVDAVVLHNTSATSIDEFDFDYQTDGSATLTTDKADYFPTDTVLITGTGFTPNETYSLEITSDTGNFKFSDRVTSDESGNLFYSYQLDGTYRPDYKAEIKNGDTIVATTTFTDSQEDYKHWSDVDTNWINGALNDTKSDYFEGEVIPHYWKAQGLTIGNTYGLNIYYDYYDPDSPATCGFDYLAQYNLSRAPSVVDSSPSIDDSLPEGHGTSNHPAHIDRDCSLLFE